MTVGIIPVGFPKGAGSAEAHARLAARRFVGGMPLIEWLVRRASEAQRLDRIVVLLPSGGRGDRIRQLVPPRVAVHTVPEGARPLDGMCQALESLRATAAVRLQLESPLADPELMDRLVRSALSPPPCDYASFCSSQGEHALTARLGLVAEWFSAAALRRAADDLDPQLPQPDVGSYLCAHPECFALRLIPLPEPLDRPDLRLALHHPEDWEHAHTIADALGEERLEWQRIARLVASQPTLLRRMRELNAGERGAARS